LFQFLGVEGLGTLDLGIARLEKIVMLARVEALKAAGEVLKEEWKAKVEERFPRGTTNMWGYVRTGAYHDSIEISDIVPIPTMRGEVVGVEVGTDLKYPFYLEYGTRTMKDAYPTMTPAFENKKFEAIAEAGVVFREMIEIEYLK